MAGRYDEICHDNKIPLPPNSLPGKEDERFEETEDEGDGPQFVGQKKWMNEDNPYLWDGELDADDFAEWNNGN